MNLDENNQYGYAMTKPMPTGSIEKEPQPTWRTFNILLERADLNDSTGHLFVVDISFDYCDLIRAELEEKYNNSVMKLSKDDKFYQVKLTALKAEKKQDLESVEAFKKKN